MNTLTIAGVAIILILAISVVLAVVLSSGGNQSVSNSHNPNIASQYGESLSGAQATQLKEFFSKQIAQLKQDSEKQTQQAVAEVKKNQLSLGDNAEPINYSAIEQQIQQKMMAKLNAFKEGLQAQFTDKKKDNYSDVKVNDGKPQTHNGVVWIKDVTVPEQPSKGASRAGLGGWSPFGTPTVTTDNGSDNQSSTSATVVKKEVKPIPYYTIPPNSVMTGVIPLQPLIGRIPKGKEGNVYQPFSVMFVTEHPTLMAQGQEAPLPVAKMTGTALCVGDFMSHSVSCQVKSMTFIFPDGHFQVVNLKDAGNNALSSGLGTLADAYGNPQIFGELKSSLALRLAVTGGMAGVMAYGQGLAQAQVQNFGGSETTVSSFQRISNSNQYALGQAVSGMASGAADEWKDISKNMYDYVFVPNWNKETKRLIRLNIIINKQIDIDYDKNGRKVNYERALNDNSNNIIL